MIWDSVVWWKCPMEDFKCMVHFLGKGQKMLIKHSRVKIEMDIPELRYINNSKNEKGK